MEYLCHFTSSYSVPCQEEDLLDQHGICIFPEEVCDGIPHCPNATDETLSKCKQYFSNAAQMKCHRPNIGNGLKVPTLAIRCNGIPECEDGEDEANCQFSKMILYVALLPGSVILFVISYCVLSHTHELGKKNTKEQLCIEGSDSDKRYHLITSQFKMNRGLVNRRYFQEVLDKHSGQHHKALNDMKVGTFVCFLTSNSNGNNQSVFLAKYGTTCYAESHRRFRIGKFSSEQHPDQFGQANKKV